MKGHPLVSIQCLVYNHEPYLRQCLDGFVMQKTNFGFEAIVHDDASTDNSAAILREYAEKYPSIIKPIYETENQYRKGTLTAIMDNAVSDSTKYIAICEGDDYWTDPLKLQKQVDYLEGHPNCGLVWAKAKCYYQNKGKFIGTKGHYMSGYYDMFVNYSIPPLTVLYRASSSTGYADFIKGQKWLLGDAPLFLYIAHDHDIHFMDEIVGVYRILKNSASHHTSYEQKIRFKNSTFDVVKFFCEKYGHPNFKQLESIHYSYMFNYAFNDARYDTAKEFYSLIPYPTLKIRMKRFVTSSRLLRNCYQYIYNRITK